MSNFPATDRVRGSFAQLIRYTFVGVVSNSAGYLIYLLITYLGGTPKITMTLLYGVGASIGFIGNRNFTFAHKGSLLDLGIRYFIAHFFGYFINLIILIIFVDQFGYSHQWVQAVAIFVVAGFLFIVFKFFVFTNLDVFNVDKL
jgi:putative flippase GtrA